MSAGMLALKLLSGGDLESEILCSDMSVRMYASCAKGDLGELAKGHTRFFLVNRTQEHIHSVYTGVKSCMMNAGENTGLWF
jgi:hypothetical protein